MGPDVPPDLLRVVDASGLDQERDIVLVVGPRAKVIRNVGAWKLLEYLRAIAFQSGFGAHPEGRAGGKGEHVRKEVTCGIHQMNLSFSVLDSDVDVHPKYE